MTLAMLDIRSDLRDWSANIVGVANALGLKRARERGKWACPACSSTDALSLTLGPDRTLRCKCFSCDLGGDVFTLVAVVQGLDVQRNFREVLQCTAELAGRSLDEAPMNCPPRDAVRAVWDCAAPLAEDTPEADYLAGRGFSIPRLVDADLIRVLPVPMPAHDWARFGKRSWSEAGYRLVVPVWDADGSMGALRAWCIRQPFGDAPKRIAPKGFSVRGLVMANALAVSMLRRSSSPTRVAIAEGEPDFLAVATTLDVPVLGVESGAWTDDIAASVPNGCSVVVWTHEDAAGDRYATEIHASLARRCIVFRGRTPGAGAHP